MEVSPNLGRQNASLSSSLAVESVSWNLSEGLEKGWSACLQEGPGCCIDKGELIVPAPEGHAGKTKVDGIRVKQKLKLVTTAKTKPTSDTQSPKETHVLPPEKNLGGKDIKKKIKLTLNRPKQ